jgi:hypothetical protein
MKRLDDILRKIVGPFQFSFGPDNFNDHFTFEHKYFLSFGSMYKELHLSVTHHLILPSVSYQPIIAYSNFLSLFPDELFD